MCCTQVIFNVFIFIAPAKIVWLQSREFIEVSQ